MSQDASGPTIPYPRHEQAVGPKCTSSSAHPGLRRPTVAIGPRPNHPLHWAIYEVSTNGNQSVACSRAAVTEANTQVLRWSSPAHSHGARRGRRRRLS